MSESLSLESAYAEFERIIDSFLQQTIEPIEPRQSDSLISYLQKEQEKNFTASGRVYEPLTLTSERDTQQEQGVISKILTVIAEFVSQLIDFLKKIAEFWSNHVLPQFFDIFIASSIKFAERSKKDPIFPLRFVYLFFNLIGMLIIHAKTFRRIAGSVQWRVCSTKWVDVPFWQNYLKKLPANTNPNTTQALRQMLATAKVIEADDRRIAKSQAEIYKEFHRR